MRADVISAQHTLATSKAPLAAGAGTVCSSHSCISNVVRAEGSKDSEWCLSDLATLLQRHVFSEVEIGFDTLANHFSTMDEKQALRGGSLHTILSQLGWILW